MEHASAVAAETKPSSGSFAMLEVTRSRCRVRINSRCTSGSFRSTKSLTVTYDAEVQSMPSLAQINFKKACMKNELRYVKLDLPYVLVWPGLSRFKRLSRLAKCPGISLQ